MCLLSVPLTRKASPLQFGLATLALRLLMPDYKSLVYKTSSLEGKYKFVHSRVKAASESIAFFGGDDREHKIVASRFDNVMALDWHKQILDFKFEFCQHVFQGFMPGIFQFILRFNYMVRAGGGDAEYLATKGAATYEGQWRIMTSNSILFDMLGRLMKFSDKLGKNGDAFSICVCSSRSPKTHHYFSVA